VAVTLKFKTQNCINAICLQQSDLTGEGGIKFFTYIVTPSSNHAPVVLLLWTDMHR